MAPPPLHRFVRIRWRVLLAIVSGTIVGVAASMFGGQGLPSSVLAGWLAGAVTYLIPTWVMFLRDDEATVRSRAGQDDESPVMLMTLVLSAVVASLAAIVLALHPKSHGQGHSVAPAVMSAASLVLGWLVLQSLFAVHYAHLYFGDRNDDGTADKGISFHGDQPRTYRDFVYVAICMGATCQVSDFDITNTRFRNIISLHAILAFFFNTMVLALGINILASVFGQ